MRLDSVRELKQLLPAHLNRTFAVRAAAGKTASLAVASAAALKHQTPSYFLGSRRGGRTTTGWRSACRIGPLEKSELVDRIAARAKGEVEVRYVGRIRARAKPWYRSKQRPLLIGSSTGFLASGSSWPARWGASSGPGVERAVHPLEQPRPGGRESVPQGRAHRPAGALDGGSPTSDSVAKLTRFVRLNPGQTNFVDCAIAKLNAAVQADVHKLKGIGTLAGQRTSDLQVGDVVHKVGRTTGVRHGRVTAFELDGVTVEYDIGVLSFDNQIEIEGAGNKSFSDAGDSGSLIADDHMLAAALLFCGRRPRRVQRQGADVRESDRAVLQASK